MQHHFSMNRWNRRVIMAVLDLYHWDVISCCWLLNIVVNTIHLALMALPRTVGLLSILNQPLLYPFAVWHLQANTIPKLSNVSQQYWVAINMAHGQQHLLSRISSCRFASPRAENKSSLTRVSADRFFSKVVFLSCIAWRADIRTSVLSRASRCRNSASNFRNCNNYLIKFQYIC